MVDLSKGDMNCPSGYGAQLYAYMLTHCSAIWGVLAKDDDLRASHEQWNILYKNIIHIDNKMVSGKGCVYIGTCF